MKSVQIRNFSGPYFPAFGLNTEKYRRNTSYLSVLCPNADQKNSEYGHFSRNVNCGSKVEKEDLQAVER